jgi:hypothetical protein
MIRVIRRDDKIQKDFFSAAEYGIYAVVQEFELPYYKKKKSLNNKKLTLSSHSSDNSRSTRSSRRNSRDLSDRRRGR